MKYWEIIADNLSKAGFSRGLGLGIVSSGRTIWMLTRIAAKESVSFCVPMKTDCVFAIGSSDSHLQLKLF